jgi:hypothetical protein
MVHPEATTAPPAKQWQAPAEPAAEHTGERRDDRNQHLQGNEGKAHHQRRQVHAPDHHERDQGQHDRERSVEERGEEVRTDDRPRGEEGRGQHGVVA